MYHTDTNALPTTCRRYRLYFCRSPPRSRCLQLPSPLESKSRLKARTNIISYIHTRRIAPRIQHDVPTRHFTLYSSSTNVNDYISTYSSSFIERPAIRFTGIYKGIEGLTYELTSWTPCE